MFWTLNEVNVTKREVKRNANGNNRKRDIERNTQEGQTYKD
jgi:hypothetical protein